MRHLLLLLLVWSTNVFAWDQREPNPIAQCQIHAPYGFPKSIRAVQLICRQAYLVGYDAAAKIPQYVAYSLKPEHAAGCVKRSNSFVADNSVVNGATLKDYVGSGYDKGHLSPDGDLNWNVQVAYEGFLLTNITPQAVSLNRGIWKSLETAVRGWVIDLKQPFTIYAGGVYTSRSKKIGSGVVVPDAFYKVVINNITGETAGWLFPHTKPYPNLGNDLTVFRMSIFEIEKTAGVSFKFPKKAIELKVGKEWPINYGPLATAKKNTCLISN